MKPTTLRKIFYTLVFLSFSLTGLSSCRLVMDVPDAPEGECGNQVQEGLEPCDGSDLHDKTCADLGFDAGDLSCKADCTFDTSLCFLSSQCGPGNCAGCCAPGGVCEAGDTDEFCGSNGGACLNCFLFADTSCRTGLCEESPCVDGDGDGRGVECDAGTDDCEDDVTNWTAVGCASCRDADADGFRGTDCDAPEDPCDGDVYNWTAVGCANCHDADADGWRGEGCDRAEDCDDGAPGVVGPCQANGCPSGWIHIPAGPFQQGCNEGELDGLCEPLEQPRHTTTLSAYCMMPTEVSVEMFRACRSAGLCTASPGTTLDHEFCNYSEAAEARETHPLNCLPWDGARQFCAAWFGGDLPSEAQWEKAARGPDGDTRKFPWGNSPEPNCNNSNYNYCFSATPPVTWPVGHLTSGAGDSPYGLKDCAGNVWEWTLDDHDESIYASCAGGCTDPVNLGAGGYKIIRGGDFHHALPGYLRTVTRAGESSTAISLTLGLRCRRPL